LRARDLALNSHGESVDLFIDGERQERPVTKFS
jgi:hypothetical protein